MNKLTIYVSKDNDLLLAKNPDHLFPELDHKTKLPLHPTKVCGKVLTELSYITTGDTNRSIATHSKCFVDKVGDYIEDVDRQLRHHVEIVVLHSDQMGYLEHTSTFDEDVCLVDWPIGFFCGR